MVIKILKYFGASLVLLLTLVLLLFGYGDRSVEELSEKYAQPPSKFVEVGGMNVHYRDEGNPTDSLPLVLIHGTSSSLHTYDGWAAGLEGRKRIIRMDMPGFGLTGPSPEADYRISQYADFLRNFLMELQVPRCIVAGNSLGGNIAWTFTLAYPEMVEKLILIDASGYPTKATSVPVAFKMARTPVINKLLTIITPRRMARASVENVYVDKSLVTDQLVDRYFELTLREGNRQALVDRMNAPQDSLAYRNIPNISQPTLILWGDQDYLIPVSAAHRFAKDLPNDTLIVMKNTGHVPMEEQPMESLAAIKPFLMISD